MAMNEGQSRHPGKVGVWLMAARPKTLPAAAAPVIVGSALAWHEGVFRFGPALAALGGALLLQIGANLANDVFDFHRGADNDARLGPLRVTQAGLLSPQQVKAGMWGIFGLATLLGFYLVGIAGWPVIAIGITAILAALAYTGGPFPLGYYGLGEVFVFIYFGLAAVCGTYYVQAGTVSLAAWSSAVPLGLLIVAILVVNNLRDIEGDRAAGKHTLAVRLGVSGTQMEYVLCILGAYGSVSVMASLGLVPPAAWLIWLSAPVAYRLVRSIYQETGRSLNRALAGTGQLTLVFGILFALGIVI